MKSQFTDPIGIPDAHNSRWVLAQDDAEAEGIATQVIESSSGPTIGRHPFADEAWMSLELGEPITRTTVADSKSWSN